jgi:DNA-binding transcriptional LysR family regulator
MISVASPEFIHLQKIQTIKDTEKAPLLHTSSRPTSWQEYLEKVGFEGRPYLTRRYFDQFSMVILAVQASLGIGLFLKYLVKREISKDNSS